MNRKMHKTSNEKRPVEHYDHLDDAFGNAGSATECTGLIAHAPLTEEELESFMDIYDFSPPMVISDSVKDGSGPAYGSDITDDSIQPSADVTRLTGGEHLR